MIAVPQDYLKTERHQLFEQPQLHWNIQSVLNREDWVQAYPSITRLPESPDEQIEDIPRYLEAEAGKMRLGGANVSIHVSTALETKFNQLSKQWKLETGVVSSVTDIVMHPAYQRIMAMGKDALPMILRDLRDYSGHWFHALESIVGSDIASGATSIDDARASWLQWGYANGYL